MQLYQNSQQPGLRIFPDREGLDNTARTEYISAFWNTVYLSDLQGDRLLLKISELRLFLDLEKDGGVGGVGGAPKNLNNFFAF